MQRGVLAYSRPGRSSSGRLLEKSPVYDTVHGFLDGTSSVGCRVLCCSGVAFRSSRWQSGLLHYGIDESTGRLSTGYICVNVSTFGFAPFKYVFVLLGSVLTAPLFLLTPEGIFSQRIGNGWKTGIAEFLLYGDAAVWGMLRVRDAAMLRRLRWALQISGVFPALLFIVALAGRRYGKAWHVRERSRREPL